MTQSLDLVDGSVDRVAAPVEAEMRRFVQGEALSTGWRRVPDIAAAFSLVPALAEREIFVLQRVASPATIVVRTRGQVLRDGAAGRAGAS